MNELHRKARVLWLSLRIKYNRIAMDAEMGISEQWKYHARTHTALCRKRADLLSPAERREVERREGLV